MIRRLISKLLLTVFVSPLLISCAAEPPPPMALAPEVVRSSQRFTREYVLQPGDQIEVTVFHVPELTRSVIVRPDGYISLPILKDVKAAGLSVPELNQDLERRFAGRLNDPNVTVTVMNPKQASIFVLGEVNHPAPVPVRDAPTVAQAIAAAGGVMRSAALDNVAVVRLEDDGVLAGYILKRENSGETAFYMTLAGMSLKPGDMVIVPESGRSQFVRFIQDYINTPLSGVNNAIAPYLQYETLRLVNKSAR